MIPERVLVVRFSSLGDVVLTAPVLKNIKEAWPRCKITLATKRQFAGVLAGNPDVDEILPLDEKKPFWDYLRLVRAKRFNVVVDLHSNLRSRLLSFFSGAQKRVRYSKAVLARRFLVMLKIKSPVLYKHTLERYLETLIPLGITPKKYPPQISLGEHASPALKILVIQTAFLGDAVLTMPIFSEIKKNWPQTEIDILTSPEVAEVFRGHADLRKIIVFDKRQQHRGFFPFLNFAKSLRGQYDVAILPHRSFRSALLAWIAQIPKRIGFEKSQGNIFLTEIVPFDWKTHDAQRNLKLLQALGFPEASAQVSIAHKLSGRFDAQKFGINLEQKWVGMNPGSVWNTKRWLPEYFAEVADGLSAQGYRVLLVGSPKDRTAACAVVAMAKSKILNLCGKTNLQELMEIVALCRLFITNDSGPMHVACALQVPVVAIFGATTRELGFFPLGDKSTVVEADLDCRPCALHGGNACPLGHFLCMKNVKPQMVLDAAKKYLS